MYQVLLTSLKCGLGSLAKVGCGSLGFDVVDISGGVITSLFGVMTIASLGTKEDKANDVGVQLDGGVWVTKGR